MGNTLPRPQADYDETEKCKSANTRNKPMALIGIYRIQNRLKKSRSAFRRFGVVKDPHRFQKRKKKQKSGEHKYRDRVTR